MRYYKVTVHDKQFLLKVKDSSKLVDMVKEFARKAQPFLVQIGRNTGIEKDKKAQDDLYKIATDVYTQMGREVQNMKSKGMIGTLDRDDDPTWYDTNLDIALIVPRLTTVPMMVMASKADKYSYSQADIISRLIHSKMTQKLYEQGGSGVLLLKRNPSSYNEIINYISGK